MSGITLISFLVVSDELVTTYNDMYKCVIVSHFLGDHFKLYPFKLCFKGQGEDIGV